MKIITISRKFSRSTFITSGVCVLLIICLIIGATYFSFDSEPITSHAAEVNEGKKYIKWVDFGVSTAAMRQAMKYDIDSYSQSVKISWIDLLAIAACKNGGRFPDKQIDIIDQSAKRIKSGEKAESIAESEYFSYYKQSYTAVLGGFLGEYKREEYDESSVTKKSIKTGYGLVAYSPIAGGYGYSHSDDFGNSRSYGFKRTHLGNDLMSEVGTPVISVEDGIVECMGWNQYGGWRIGIRSLDYKRYYYYAHLRRGHPYVNTLKEGMTVKAGDVIGYVGMTGYSANEDYNGMQAPHLHFGIQLIFDESQKDGSNEIWIDVYQIVRLLSSHKSYVSKDEQTKDYIRKYKVFSP